MIINASTEDGAKAKIYNADGTEVQLPIKSYNTETQEVTHYEYDENGKIKMSEWKPSGKEGRLFSRDPVLTVVKLPGSYATIDGKKV